MTLRIPHGAPVNSFLLLVSTTVLTSLSAYPEAPETKILMLNLRKKVNEDVFDASFSFSYFIHLIKCCPLIER